MTKKSTLQGDLRDEGRAPKGVVRGGKEEGNWRRRQHTKQLQRKGRHHYLTGQGGRRR